MLEAIVSGGQTGVDQAALEAGTKAGLRIGGYCPPGRVCENGLIPSTYPLIETQQDRSPQAPDISHSQRTENNVIHSDATLIISPMGMITDQGTAWTRKVAEQEKKPCLVVDPFQAGVREKIADWIADHAIETLHVAGPGEKTSPGIGMIAYSLLLPLFLKKT